MTVVNWHLQPNGVMVMTDSLLGYGRIDEDPSRFRPAAFIQKAFPIAHLDALGSGRGDGDLIAAWMTLASTRVLARDFDMLCDLAPRLIRELIGECDDRRGGPYPGTSSIFMWGWSSSAQRVTGFAFRSAADFQPEPMVDGLMFAPTFSETRQDLREALRGEGANIPVLMIEAIRQQHIDARKGGPDGDRNIVGGEVMLSTLTVAERGEIDISCRRLFRFDDYESDYEAALNVIEPRF